MANPNCTTMAIMLPLKALHDEFGLREIVATSFQAAGGAGQKGMDELATRSHRCRRPSRSSWTTRAADPERDPALSIHADTLAYNVVPWLGSEAGDGYSDEEMKLAERVAQDPRPPRPQRRADVRARARHGRALHPACRATLRGRGGRRSPPDRPGRRSRPEMVVENGPTPVKWAGSDEVAVGRIRPDLADPRSLNLFVVGDNLLKGAALNTVQIAELLHERGLLGAPARVTRRLRHLTGAAGRASTAARATVYAPAVAWASWEGRAELAAGLHAELAVDAAPVRPDRLGSTRSARAISALDCPSCRRASDVDFPVREPGPLNASSASVCPLPIPAPGRTPFAAGPADREARWMALRMSRACVSLLRQAVAPKAISDWPPPASGGWRGRAGAWRGARRSGGGRRRSAASRSSNDHPGRMSAKAPGPGRRRQHPRQDS